MDSRRKESWPRMPTPAKVLTVALSTFFMAVAVLFGAVLLEMLIICVRFLWEIL